MKGRNIEIHYIISAAKSLLILKLIGKDDDDDWNMIHSSQELSHMKISFSLVVFQVSIIDVSS